MRAALFTLATLAATPAAAIPFEIGPLIGGGGYLDAGLAYTPGVSVGAGMGIRPLPWLRVEGKNVVLSAVKRAEESDALIVRLFNPSHEATEATVSLPVRLSEAARVDLQETPIESLPLIDAHGTRVALAPKQIVTLQLVPA